MFAVNMNYMSRDPDVPHRCADVLQLRCFLPHYTCFMLMYFRWIAVCTYYYYFFKLKPGWNGYVSISSSAVFRVVSLNEHADSQEKVMTVNRVT